MKSSVAIVLVEPENPDNIGATVRVMKNMGLSDLRLVLPPEDWKFRAKKMAVQAKEILEKAGVFQNLQDAIEDSYLIVGTTTRFGPKRGTFISFDKAVKKIKVKADQKKTVAILFGKESKGLDNASLALCDWVTSIPTNPDYPSLNLAQAVMVTAFSIFSKNKKSNYATELEFIPQRDVQDLLKRFEAALKILRYEEEGGDIVRRILRTFHGLIKRNGMLESEAQMFRGLTRRIVEKDKSFS